MLNKIVLLYFLTATVTGQLQLQNNDQNALQQVQLQLPAEQTQQIAPGISLGLSRRSKAKPCHRRKSSENLNTNSRSGWVPTFHSKSVYPVDQKVPREASQDLLTPQSLKESPISVQEETSKTVTETSVPNNVLYQNEVLEADENKYDPDQLIRDAYLKAQEHSKSVPDQDKNQYPVGTVENYAELGPSGSPSSDPEDGIEASNELCRRSGEAEENAENVDEYSRSSNSRSLPDDVQKQALKLISRCVQTVKSDESSRKDQSSNLSYSPMVNVPIHDNNNGLSRQDEENNLRRNNDFDASQPPTNLILSSGPSPSVIADDVETPKPEKKGTRKLRNRKLNADAIEVQLQQPATGVGISHLQDSKVMLMENGRVCFACSSTTDPSCWQPGPTTTIKYCKKGDDACVTKTFKTKSDLVTIRDCGNSCNENDIPGVSPKYKSCQICHSDQCNSGHAISSLNIFIVTCVMTAFKFAL